MKRLIPFFQKLRIGQILTVFLVGAAFLITTACSGGDIRGARPDNPATQIGGENNPYKAGGDENTNYRMSPDPNVNSKAVKPQGNRADLQSSDQLVAANVDGNASDLLYPGSDATETENPGIGPSI